VPRHANSYNRRHRWPSWIRHLFLEFRHADNHVAGGHLRHGVCHCGPGTWDGTAVINGKESKAVKTEKLGLGNLWLIEHFQTDIDGVKFEGHGMTTYDSLKKKYVNIWIDSMSTSPMISEGNFEKGNRLVMKGKFSTPDGKTLDFTTITERKDENHMVVVVDGTGPDGKNVEFIKITYKRRQK
jgi:hypothetical protein